MNESSRELFEQVAQLRKQLATIIQALEDTQDALRRERALRDFDNRRKDETIDSCEQTIQRLSQALEVAQTVVVDED